MARKKEQDIITEIRKNMEKKQLVLGADRTLKLLKIGKIQKIYLTKNPNPELKNDLEYYKKISTAEIIDIDVTQDELGVICKKPFPISVIGLLK